MSNFHFGYKSNGPKQSYNIRYNEPKQQFYPYQQVYGVPHQQEPQEYQQVYSVPQQQEPQEYQTVNRTTVVTTTDRVVNYKPPPPAVVHVPVAVPLAIRPPVYFAQRPRTPIYYKQTQPRQPPQQSSSWYFNVRSK